MAITVDVEGDALLGALDRAIGVLASPLELFEDIGAKLELNAQVRFDTKTDPTGAKWKPLKPATIERKRGVGSLLIATNVLRQSLAFNATDEYVEIGTSRATPGGAWQVGFLHEFGTRRMPRRGILLADPESGTLGEQDEADILAIVVQSLDGAFG